MATHAVPFSLYPGVVSVWINGEDLELDARYTSHDIPPTYFRVIPTSLVMRLRALIFHTSCESAVKEGLLLLENCTHVESLTVTWGDRLSAAHRVRELKPLGACDTSGSRASTLRSQKP